MAKPKSSLINKQEMRLLEIAAKENISSQFKYFSIGLALGLEYGVLVINSHRPRREMLLAANIENEIEPKEFFSRHLSPLVETDVRYLYGYRNSLLPFEEELRMEDWENERNRSHSMHISAFEHALLCFATTLTSLDKLDHRRIETNRSPHLLPPAHKALRDIEEEDLSQCVRKNKGGILVNELLDQMGYGSEELSRLLSPGEDGNDPTTWDMRLLVFKVLREVWNKKTCGHLLDKMNGFTDYFTETVEKCINSYTLKCIVLWFLPERLSLYHSPLKDWIRQSLLNDWHRLRSSMLNVWGSDKGFTMDSSCTSGSSTEEDEEDAPPSRKTKKVKRANSKKTIIDFNPDNPQFIQYLLTCDNRYYLSYSLEEMDKHS